MKSRITSLNLVFPSGYESILQLSYKLEYSTYTTPSSIHLFQTQSVLDCRFAYNSLLHEMVKINSQSCKKVLLKQVLIKERETWPADSLCGTNFLKKTVRFLAFSHI